jgi:hypothetical protein
MHDYNTGRTKLLLKEYGRNIQNLITHITTIEDKTLRTQHARAIFKLMSTLSTNGKHVEYNQKRWDDLFIISDYKLDIEGNHIMPHRDTLVKQPQRLTYCKQPIKYKHYGRHIELLAKKAAEISDSVAQERAIIGIAKLVKNFSTLWNKDNLDTETLLATIQNMVHGKLVIDLDKIKLGNNFYSHTDSNYKEKHRLYKRNRAGTSSKN